MNELPGCSCRKRAGLYFNQVVSYARGAIDAAQLDRRRSPRRSTTATCHGFQPSIKAPLVSLVAMVGAAGLRRIRPALRARNHVEGIFKADVFACSFGGPDDPGDRAVGAV